MMVSLSLCTCSHQEAISAMHGASWLFTELLNKVYSKELHHVKALKAGISLMLGTATKLMSYSSISKEHQKIFNDDIVKAMSRIGNGLKVWVGSKFSGAVFGGTHTFFQDQYSRDELQVCLVNCCTCALVILFVLIQFWNTLLRVNCPDHDVLAVWHNEAIKIVKDRISRVVSGN